MSRKECRDSYGLINNKRRSDGVAVIYEPEPGYTGTDSISLDAISPSGVLSKRHYAIDVR
jgi:hypothetical protein